MAEVNAKVMDATIRARFHNYLHYDYDMISPTEEAQLDEAAQQSITRTAPVPVKHKIENNYQALALAVIERAMKDYLFHVYREAGYKAPSTGRTTKMRTRLYNEARAFLLDDGGGLQLWADVLDLTVERIREVTLDCRQDYALGMRLFDLWNKGINEREVKK